jgi:hypothetical protein
MRIISLEFGSLLSYFPSGLSDEAMRSKTAMRSLKGDEYVQNPPILMSDLIADEIKRALEGLPFGGYFNNRAILVPTPSSSLRQSGGLWVPQRLANALAIKGLGKAAVPC